MTSVIFGRYYYYVERIDTAAKYSNSILKLINSSLGYDHMDAIKRLILDELIEELNSKQLSTADIKRVITEKRDRTIDSDLDCIRRASCNDCARSIILFCSKGHMNIGNYVVCGEPSCNEVLVSSCSGGKKGEFLHSTELCLHSRSHHSENTTVIDVYAISAAIVDLIKMGNLKFFNSLTRREYAAELLFADAHHSISGLTSYNAYSVFKRLGENQLCNLININRASPMQCKSEIDLSVSFSSSK